MQDYDVIVIGAGNGGLAGAAFAAKNGFKTLVVEKHNIPGGSATSFRRGRFEFEASLHELCNLGSEDNKGGIWNLFELLGSDCEWKTSYAETFRMLVPNEDIDVTMPCGVPNFIGKLEQECPGSAPIMMQVAQLGGMAAQAYAALDEPGLDMDEFNAKYPDFYRLAGHSIKEVLTALGMPEKAQKIVSNYWCYLGANWEELDFLIYARMLMAYIVYGAGFPAKFSHEISMSLDKVIRDNGGEIWYNTEVEKMIVEDGKVAGIVLDGKEYRSKYIISNAYPDVVYGKMMDQDQVPERANKLTRSRELGLSFVTVYLGMNKTSEELGIEAYSTFISDSGDSTVCQAAATNTHDFTKYVIINCLNNIVEDATPAGTSQLFLTTAYFGNGWDDVTADNYWQIKEDIAEQCIKYCEENLGIEIMPYIEEIEIATPVTFARYLNSPNGTPYGYQVKPGDSFIERGYTLKDETFFDNLFFAGAASKRGDGYSSTYLSGIDAGKAVLINERMKGGVER